MFQFQDSAATKLGRKKGFEMLFLFHAALPMLLASSVLIIYQWHIDVMMGFELLSYFSPLTNWDVFILYTFQASGFIMPIIQHKSYKRMENSLAEFSQLYIQSMHGLICKGTFCTYNLLCISRGFLLCQFRRNWECVWWSYYKTGGISYFGSYYRMFMCYILHVDLVVFGSNW